MLPVLYGIPAIIFPHLSKLSKQSEEVFYPKKKMNWLLLLASAIVATVAWTVISVVPNYKAARSIGFPIVISPVSTLSPFWILTYRVFPSILTLKRLPFGLGTWARCTYMGWSFQDKHALHDELGHIFTIVTPGGNEVIVADPETAQTVFARRKDFIKPAMMYGMHIFSGPFR